MERALKGIIACPTLFLVAGVTMLLVGGYYSTRNYMADGATVTEAVGYAYKDLSNGISKIREGLRYKGSKNHPE